jgi:hypothetical protein
LALETINSFRSLEDLRSAEPAQLKRTIWDLEQQIESYRNVIERQAERIQELEATLDLRHGDSVKLPASSSLEMELKLEQYADAFIELYETEEDFSSEVLDYFKQLPATPQTKELAGRLRTFPSQLRNARIRKQIDPFQAYKELRELSAEALRFIWQHPKAAEPLKVEVFRAQILLESLKNGVRSLDTQDVIKSLTMVESHRIDRKQALRAMRRAASLEPLARFEQKARRKAILYLIKEVDA